MSTLDQIVSTPFDWAREAGRVIHAPLSRRLKRQVLRTQAGLYLRGLWQREDRLIRCRIVEFDVSGFSFRTLAFLFREIFVDLDYYFETPSRAPYILDCGSNIGMSVLFFKSLYPDAVIDAFEAAPDTFEVLQTNLRANRVTDVQPYQVAVGASETTIDFYTAARPGSLTSSAQQSRTGGRRTTVRQLRLSSFVTRPVDLLKLDVEGGEWGVMQDLIESGTIGRISQMVVEYHHHLTDADDRLAEFLTLLQENGFGYQIRANANRARRPGEFQDILVYAYRKQLAS